MNKKESHRASRVRILWETIRQDAIDNFDENEVSDFHNKPPSKILASINEI